MAKQRKLIKVNFTYKCIVIYVLDKRKAAQTVENEQQKTEAALSTDEEYADACDSPPVMIEANSIG